MAQRTLKQIKVFRLDHDTTGNTEKAVNDFVVKIFEETGNFPSIETNSKFISVIYDKLFNINR